MDFEFKNGTQENSSVYKTLYYPHYGYGQVSIPDNQRVWIWMDNYIVPTVFTIGVVFNLLTAVVILGTELKKATPCIYWVALSITDNVFLIQKMIPWASRRLYNIYDVAGICQLTYYCNYLSTFLEWWFIVMMMTERILQQYCRKKARKYCSPFRTKCSLITMGIFSIVFHLYLTWTSAVIKYSNMDMCIIIPENAEDIVQLRKVDIVFAFNIPATLVILLTMLCLHRLLQGNRQSTTRFSLRRSNRENHYESTKRQSTPVITINTKTAYLKSFQPKVFTQKASVSLLSITLSLVLLVLCLPYNCLRTKLTMFNDAQMEERHWLQLFNEIYAINFAYKGLLYLLFLPKFRLALWRLLKISIKSVFQKKNEPGMEISDV
ncbi:hypothetical protein FSP39_021523 [Pinctada imbricata]|uniref:G-protein coupled receptors family 1 profile domain-containing protein n=1 Tax=Pinctada imbricata TaxID=66713 RepID=A0AA88YG61_PINIB|nr:hypothetical protein FSP39_021523 [Pinctada imbricata]